MYVRTQSMITVHLRSFTLHSARAFLSHREYSYCVGQAAGNTLYIRLPFFDVRLTLDD